MLKALFGSETRVKLVSIFLLNPEKKYDIRSIGKETSLPSVSIRKELANLKEFGLLRTVAKDTWMVNKQFIIYPELKTLIAKAQLLSSQKFIDSLKQISTPKVLALSGIFTGDEMVKSDILVVGKIKKRPFLKILKELEFSLGQEINYTIMDETEFHYRTEVMDIFVYNILHGKTLFLVDELNKYREEDVIIKSQINENESVDN